MQARFRLDGCHDLEIVGDVPRSAQDSASVSIRILRTPLPMLVPSGIQCSDVGYMQAPTETMIAVSLQPSYARAIASALLSAATEARG